MARLSFLATILALPIIVSGCRPGGAPLSETSFTGGTMGTTYTVKVIDRTGEHAGNRDEIERAIQKRLEAINAAMSTYKEDSEISRFNRAANDEWFPVSESTAEVVAEALRIGEQTDGAFDVTIGPVLRLWHFGAGTSRKKTLPSDENIENALECTGFSFISVRRSPPALKKTRSNVTLDLSGIAKGYAVDEVARLLEANDYADYMVEIGGEVRTKGRNANGVPWRIAVEKPVVNKRSVQRVLSLHDAALATSGDYRNFFQIDGKRYSHVIDPRTARPVSHQVVSVTVVAPRCATADALATGLMVLGPQEGYDLAREKDLPALFILKTEKGFAEKPTPAFQQLQVQ